MASRCPRDRAGAARALPRPVAGPGSSAAAGGGTFQANPKLRAAIQACGGGNFRRGRRFQISHAAINNYVACVRKRGYDLPSPNFSGQGPVFPAGIRTNPKFQAASKPCQSLLFRGRGAPTRSASA